MNLFLVNYISAEMFMERLMYEKMDWDHNVEGDVR